MKTGRKDSVISSSLLPHRVLSHLVMRVPCSLPHAVTLLSLFLFFFAPRLTPPSFSISLSFSTHRSSLSLSLCLFKSFSPKPQESSLGPSMLSSISSSFPASCFFTLCTFYLCFSLLWPYFNQPYFAAGTVQGTLWGQVKLGDIHTGCYSARLELRVKMSCSNACAKIDIKYQL